MMVGFFFLWFQCRISPTGDQWLRKESLITREHTENWHYGICGCWCDIFGCCMGYWCPICLHAETWYRAGWPQSIIGVTSPCRAWSAAGFLQCILMTTCPCCICCVDGFLRGGCGEQFEEELSGGKTLERRFNIEGDYGVSVLLW